MKESDVLNLTSRFAAAWERGDATGIAAVFSEDAVFTTPEFQRFEGRAAIAEGQRSLYIGMTPRTRIAISIERLRWLRPDLALVHTENRITSIDASDQFPVSHAMLIVDGSSGQAEIVAFHDLVPVVLRGTPAPGG
jgi:uncharacterized protein (TIGR02246 family)